MRTLCCEELGFKVEGLLRGGGGDYKKTKTKKRHTRVLPLDMIVLRGVYVSPANPIRLAGTRVKSRCRL